MGGVRAAATPRRGSIAARSKRRLNRLRNSARYRGRLWRLALWKVPFMAVLPRMVLIHFRQDNSATASPLGPSRLVHDYDVANAAKANEAVNSNHAVGVDRLVDRGRRSSHVTNRHNPEVSSPVARGSS